MSTKEDINGWLKKGEDRLVNVKDEKAKRSFSDVAYNLQQSEEHIAKATLMCMHLSTTRSRAPKIAQIQQIMNSIFDINKITPKDYTHGWHSVFLDNLKGFYSSPIFQGFISPDTIDKIEKARAIQDMPNVPLSEVDIVLKMCTDLLDAQIDVGDDYMKLDSVLPNATLSVNKQLMDFIKSFFNNDKETIDFITNKMRISTNIIVLAILDIILAPHEDARFDPDTKHGLTYDENLPVVVKSDEISLILSKCASFTKKALDDTNFAV